MTTEERVRASSVRVLGRPAVVAVVVAMSVSGCWSTSDGGPPPGPGGVPTSAAAGAELVCGMDRASLEAVTGLTVGRSEGELRVVDGVGAGECSAWPENESLVSGSLVSVRLYAASSEEGIAMRAKLLGQDGLRAPDLTWTTVEGGIWGDITPHPEKLSSGAASAALFGETVIDMLLTRGAVDRDLAAGQLALTQQVAATYGLAGSGSGS